MIYFLQAKVADHRRVSWASWTAPHGHAPPGTVQKMCLVGEKKLKLKVQEYSQDRLDAGTPECTNPQLTDKEKNERKEKKS